MLPLLKVFFDFIEDYKEIIEDILDQIDPLEELFDETESFDDGDSI